MRTTVNEHPSDAKGLEEYARNKWKEYCKNYLNKEKGFEVELLPVELKKKDLEGIKKWITNTVTNSLKGIFQADPESKKIMDAALDDKENLRVKISNTLLSHYTEYTMKEVEKEMKNTPLSFEIPNKHEEISTFLEENDINDYFQKRSTDLSWDFVIWASKEKTNRIYDLNFDQPPPAILQDWLAWLEKKKIGLDDQQKKMKTYFKAYKNFEDAKKTYDKIKEGDIGLYQFTAPSKKEICESNLYNTRKFINEVEDRAVDEIRVMHWNILADGLAGSGLSMNLYEKSLEKQFASPKECLVWSYRKWLILEEIAHYDPDIITLVELDKKYAKVESLPEQQQEETLEYWLGNLGYKIEFFGKKSAGGMVEHGTGFFWKKNVLEKVENPIWKPFEEGGQTFGLIRFTLKSSKEKLAVCTLHLESKKETKGEEIRVNQLWNALYWLNFKKYTDDLTNTWHDMGIDKNKKGVEIGREVRTYPDLNIGDVMTKYKVIITGDFNAERTLSYDEKGKIVQPGAVGVPYLAGFKSFYDEVYGGDLPWTSWKKRPAGRTDKYAIDYIFGSKKTKGINVLGPVPDGTDAFDKNTLLPNWNYGSDHISLVVDFTLDEGHTPKKMKTHDNIDQGEEENIFMQNKGIIAIAIIVVVITILLWKCRGTGNRRSRSQTASETSKNESKAA